jgi:hypothetical protein
VGRLFLRVAPGSLSLRKACELLGLSYRQGERLWARYRTGGSAGLQHGLCGRVVIHDYGGEFRAVVPRRVSEREQDFGPTLASEHLAAADQLQVSAELGTEGALRRTAAVGRQVSASGGRSTGRRAA